MTILFITFGMTAALLIYAQRCAHTERFNCMSDTSGGGRMRAIKVRARMH